MTESIFTDEYLSEYSTKKNKRKNIKSFDIFDYWKDKAITEDGEIVLDSSENFSMSVPVIEDFGEPSCWCCNKPVNLYTMKGYDNALEKNDFRTIWNYAKVSKKLERAHIIPHALNGSSSPDNFFLLCASCHSKSPDFIEAKMFYKYIYKNRTNPNLRWPNNCASLDVIPDYKLASVTDLIEQICIESNITPLELNSILTKDILVKAQEKINTHGNKLAISTIKVLIDSIIEKYKN